MKRNQCRRIVEVLGCAVFALFVSSSGTLAQEPTDKKMSTTYGIDEDKMAGVVLTLTPSGKQYSVTGYYYMKPLAGITADPGMRTPIKGVYSPATKKVRGRAILIDKNGTKTEIPVTADYDPVKDAFVVKIDTRFIVPRDQLRPDEIYKSSGSVVELSCEWTRGDKIDLTVAPGPNAGTMQKGSGGEDHHHPPKASPNKKP